MSAAHDPAAHLMNTYGRLPIALSHGQGCRVWDVNGKEYLDALAGIAVNTLGHNHPVSIRYPKTPLERRNFKV